MTEQGTPTSTPESAPAAVSAIFFIGGMIGTYSSGCPAPGYAEEPGNVVVFHSGSNVQITATSAAGTCTYGAAVTLARACWHVAGPGGGEPVAEPLAGEPATPAAHLSADVCLRLLPAVHQRAKVRGPASPQLKLAPRPAKPPAEPLAQRAWREGRTIEQLVGEVVLDADKGVPLAVKLVGTGEGVEDLAPFDAESFARRLVA